MRRLRVSLVSHQFLPDNRAGVEVYVDRLARGLMAQGHEVLVYTTRKDLTRRDGEVFDEDAAGLRVRRVVRNLFHAGFEGTFRDERAEAAFERAVLQDFAPDVVHVHHLMHQSLGLPLAAKARGVPVIMTLHDYWLECPRFGRLLAWDDGICTRVDLERCSRCLQTFGWRNPPSLRTVAGLLRGLRRLTGLDAQRPLQRLFRKRAAPAAGSPAPDASLVAALVARQSDVKQRVLPAVDRFLTTSRFLRQRMLDFGLDGDRLVWQSVGVERPGQGFVRRPGDGRLRFAFCGTVMPHKGVHVLLEAFAELRRKRGDVATLAIHGSCEASPAYGASMARRADALGAAVTGPYEPGEIDRVLADCDALVVPSLWFENQPLVMLDARVRGIPCLASDTGGMIELIGEPRLRFRPGDALDLARAMEAALDLRGQLGQLAERNYLPPTPDEDLAATVKHYAEFVR